MIRPRNWLLVPLTVVVAIAGLIWGGRNTYVSARNLAPLAITCADYLAKPPDAEWLRLEDCVVDFPHASVETKPAGAGTETIAIYLPLRPRGSSSTGPAKLLLRIDRGPLMFASSTPEHIEADFARPLEGLAELAIDRSTKSKARLREIDDTLAADFAVISRDARPRPLWLALAILAVGLGAVALLVRRLVRWRRSRPAPLAKAVVVAERDR